MDSFKEMQEQAKQAVTQATQSVDVASAAFSKAITTASRTAVTSGAQLYAEGQVLAEQYTERAKRFIETGCAHYQVTEELVFGHLKEGIAFAVANPYISYPVGTLGALLLLPGTRRLLYRQTLGRFRNAQDVFKNCEGRVEGLRTKVDDYKKEAEKLQAKMKAAEEEMTRGMASLKATRVELQRLASIVGKSEKVAQATVNELRSLNKVENLYQLRSEAASQAAALKYQRKQVEKYVYRILKRDI